MLLTFSLFSLSRWTVNKYERKWHYGGATIEYSGVVSPYNEESIHASRPIDRPIYIEVYYYEKW